MIKSTTLLRLFQTAYLTFFVYLFILGILNVLVIRQIAESNDQAVRAAKISRGLVDIKTNLLSGESAQRGYLLTKRRDYIISYTDHRTEIEAIQKDLDQQIIEPDQIRRYNSLLPRVKQKLEEMDETIRLQQAGDEVGAKALVLTGVGKTLMEEIDSNIEEMRTTALDMAGEARTQVQRLTDWLQFILVVGVVGFAIFTVLSYRKIAERFTPLTALAHRSTMISEGDLSGKSLAVAYNDEIGIVTEAYNSMLMGLKRIFSRTEHAQAKILEISSRLARSSAEQASSSVQQSTAVQETAVTLEELSQSATQIAERASEVGGESRATAGNTKRGLEAVQESIRLSEKARQGVEDVAATIVALSQKAQDLEAIVSSVNELAERSNILSINASIQAAAAGSEGVTFAVLANEMRLLANRSKEATVEVKDSLQEIRGGIHKAVMLAEEAVKRSESGDKNSRRTEETIRSLIESFRKGDEAFQQIVAATRQQSHAFKQVEEALVSIQETSSQAETGSRELERDSQELTQLSRQLTKTMSSYDLEDTGAVADA